MDYKFKKFTVLEQLTYYINYIKKKVNTNIFAYQDCTDSAGACKHFEDLTY